MKHYLIYKVTNVVNNKFYVGKHITENLDDDYLGSGKLLDYAKKKYGVDKFKKEILYDFSTKQLMNEMEAKIVDEDFLTRPDVYNIKKGGDGGWDHVNDNGFSSIGGKKGWKTCKENKVGLFSIESQRKGIDTQRKNKSGFFRSDISSNRFLGKKHTEDTKKRISIKSSIHQKGSGNSQFGTCWINNSKKNKKINKEELQNYIQQGWIKGRKMNFLTLFV